MKIKNTAKKENKIFTCPNCKSDLRKVGFYSFEEAEEKYRWTFDKKGGYFNSRSVGTEPLDGEITAECRNCGEKLDWYEFNEARIV